MLRSRINIAIYPILQLSTAQPVILVIACSGVHLQLV